MSTFDDAEALEHEALLVRAGGQVREDEAQLRSETWARFAAGELDEASTRAALLEEFPELDEDTLAHGLAVFAPPAHSQAQLDRVLASVEALTVHSDGDGDGDGKGDEAPAHEAQVVSLDARRRVSPAWFAGMVAVTVAAAAVALLWLNQPNSGSGGDESGPRIAQLEVEYALETDLGSADTRSTKPGPDSDPLGYVSGDRFTWVLRPQAESSVAPSVGIHAFDSSDRAGEGRVIERPELVEIRGPSVRVTGSIDALGLEPGAWTIVLVLAADPAGLPAALSRTALPEVGEVGDVGGGAAQAFRIDLQLGD